MAVRGRHIETPPLLDNNVKVAKTDKSKGNWGAKEKRLWQRMKSFLRVSLKDERGITFWVNLTGSNESPNEINGRDSRTYNHQRLREELERKKEVLFEVSKDQAKNYIDREKITVLDDLGGSYRLSFDCSWIDRVDNFQVRTNEGNGVAHIIWRVKVKDGFDISKCRFIPHGYISDRWDKWHNAPNVWIDTVDGSSADKKVSGYIVSHYIAGHDQELEYYSWSWHRLGSMAGTWELMKDKLPRGLDQVEIWKEMIDEGKWTYKTNTKYPPKNLEFRADPFEVKEIELVQDRL